MEIPAIGRDGLFLLLSQLYGNDTGEPANYFAAEIVDFEWVIRFMETILLDNFPHATRAYGLGTGEILLAVLIIRGWHSEHAKYLCLEMTDFDWLSSFEKTILLDNFPQAVRGQRNG